MGVRLYILCLCACVSWVHACKLLAAPAIAYLTCDCVRAGRIDLLAVTPTPKQCQTAETALPCAHTCTSSAQAHRDLGNKWSDIAKRIPGRSENAVKNHWNATLRRRDVPDQHPSALKVYMTSLNLVGSPRGRGSRSRKKR